MADWVEEYRLLSDRDRAEFARLVNRLLASTFLVKREQARRDFYFVERHESLFAGYLKAMGWELVLDKVLGVAQAVNREGGTRLPLGEWDSLLLLVLRLMYEQKRKEIRLGEDVMVRIQDIHDIALALKLRERGVVEKKYLRDAFALFRRFSLVEVLDGDVTHSDTRFLIYPTILFAVRAEVLAELHRWAKAPEAGVAFGNTGATEGTTSDADEDGTSPENGGPWEEATGG